MEIPKVAMDVVPSAKRKKKHSSQQLVSVVMAFLYLLRNVMMGTGVTSMAVAVHASLKLVFVAME
jgi:hypothetical protein